MKCCDKGEKVVASHGFNTLKWLVGRVLRVTIKSEVQTRAAPVARHVLHPLQNRYVGPSLLTCPHHLSMGGPRLEKGGWEGVALHGWFHGLRLMPSTQGKATWAKVVVHTKAGSDHMCPLVSSRLEDVYCRDAGHVCIK